MNADDQKGLIVDLETIPSKKEGDLAPIKMLGALRPDIDKALELTVSKSLPLPAALQQLDALAEGAAFVLGHNLIEHDLPILRGHAPRLALHALPVIDTLRLSPLAFPQNPYHRLVKDYKLIRDSLNSPLNDCRAALTLFHDQHQAFTHLNDTLRTELLCYQALLAPDQDSGLGAFFMHLSGQPPLPIAALKNLIPQLLRESDPSLQRDLKVCRTRLARLLDEDLPNKALHWPLAYTLAWLRVSGGNSVLPPWVRHQFPETRRLITALRDTPCGQDDCQYCRTTHDPRHELERYFGYDDFRYEVEPDENQPGKSLQRDIVLAGMRGEHVLAILATGGGKSLCYQIPALNRFHRNGSLTVIVSPLQSLMKDQVDDLLEHNIQCAATLNGLLTMPERADVLEKIQMGDVGILLVSPEQFRNKAFRRAIRQREVGAWIFDEAHCLSKWGNDFRPDYLYVSRFIHEHTGNNPLAPLGCFTATAKPDVLEDIQNHFKEKLGIEFKTFLGGHERKNLSFEVYPCEKAGKAARIHQLLSTHLEAQQGAAVVFVASRKKAEDLAAFLIDQDWSCKYFHAGLEPNTKKDIQDNFKAGQLKIIVATNAFGMGVNKADIRLVIHADIPGSLENYLQEAGRAGRDQAPARCVLLYDPEDIETQFGMSERSKLSLRDIQQILRKLRIESGRRKGDLVITSGEILQDEQVETSFSADDREADTKVVTALAWLERGDYLKREENQTKIFPARLSLKAAEAEKKLLAANLPPRRLEEFRAILNHLYNAGPAERVNTDLLMLLTGQTSEEVTGVLRQMENMGLLVNDTQITLYLRHGVVGASHQRLQHTLQLEEALFKCLREQAPDAGQDDATQDINLPMLTAALKEATGQEDLIPTRVLRLLRSLSQDRDIDSQQRSSFDLRQINSDYLKLRFKGGYTWSQIERLGEKRRMLAARCLEFLIGKLPPGMRGKDLLVETTLGQLEGVIEGDLELPHRIPPDQRRKAIEHVLLYLHKQEILTLNHGMTVMRRAMTIDVDPDFERKFRKEDYLRLDEHYREKRIQVHVMREYAEIALKEMAEALRLVLHYFNDPRSTFLKRYFSGREDVLDLATSEESWQSIVGQLSAVQKRIVTDNSDRNRLILAGPGSGKTRVIVHRIAYLLRVRRVPASSVVALTFNRHAANTIRKRLLALVGTDAYGVNVMTYHRMAMRLTGTRFARGDIVDERSLTHVLEDGVALLEGKWQMEGESENELREQLLRGYRYILVDEYQDIDDLQYRLVSALAGRHAEEDGRLCILAVGDDDQNIYAWRDTSNRYIERFQEEYGAETDFLVDNYRSTQHIIETANRLIGQNPARLKEKRPIWIDKARMRQPKGGTWQTLDTARQGRVLRIAIAARGRERDNANLQAQAATSELSRLLSLEQGGWNGCAILARQHSYLHPIQAWCEQHGIPYFLAADKESALPLTRQRAFIAVIDALHACQDTLNAAQAWQHITASAALLPNDTWRAFFQTAFDQLQSEFGDCPLGSGALIDWLYDYARELRQQPKRGLYLGTVHSAKGLEFRHVVLLDGGWNASPPTLSDERRLYYVGMTRAEQTLTLCEFTDTDGTATTNPFSRSLTDDIMRHDFKAAPLAELDTRFQQLSLQDIDLGYAGRQPPKASVHHALAALREGDPLTLKEDGDRYQLLDSRGNVVGRTSRAFQRRLHPEHCEVAALLVRFAEDGEEKYKTQIKSERWFVVVPRMQGHFVNIEGNSEK